MVLSQRLTIDVHTWTSLSHAPEKNGGLQGCRTASAGHAQSLAAALCEELASGDETMMS